jgi:hypothetical protein
MANRAWRKNQGIRDIDNFSLCATCPEPVEGCALRFANGPKPGSFEPGFFTSPNIS